MTAAPSSSAPSPAEKPVPTEAAETPVSTEPASVVPPAPDVAAPAPSSTAAPSIPTPPLPPETVPQPALGLNRITIYYRRGQAGSETEAKRLASLLDRTADSVLLRASGNSLRSQVIIYYNPADKDSASTLARTLAGEGESWIVRAGPNRSAPGSLSISIP